MLKTLISFAILFVTTSAQAQSIFDIEIVFFKRINELHLQGQETAIPLEAEAEYFLGNDIIELPPEYTVLERSQQKMEGVYRRLKLTSDMRPLLHIGWRQPLYDKDETPWLGFKIEDEPGQEGLQEFQGLIRFSRNQGLLIESQVIGYRQDETPAEIQPDSSEEVTSEKNQNEPELDLPFTTAEEKPTVDSQTFQENLQIPDELQGYFEMSETLKVKLDKLYYIDHPTMGILIKVTPYQASLEEQRAIN
ncbi:CsiV family protein [Kangiella sediminilitoris]|uniref:Peptidoglycan-binding protein CsiV n=1 Tax=Kangiella sediminilitoris TaxID=1144748 RepID=A0A1B3BAF1_9GAMM|nr:CsiV family protein [Kangiella sediminilitoris]AOE49769.1 hypothetical protein KS2013_1049 [Kangiella sediminilitoris]